MNKSETSFSQWLQGEGVKPLQSGNRADLSAQRPHRVNPNAAARRRAALAGAEGELTTSEIEWLHPLDPLAWKRDGVQEGVYKNLRLGHYQVDARLELMRKTPGQALDDLLSFIRECIKLDIRTVLITHGRSHQRTDSANKMKSYLSHWLPLLPEVMAFHWAQPQQGGHGAIYVLLRKSESKRQENWEKHQKR
ncbi:DNA endonuclease SmrA [Neptuniibacter sp. CAU 1671]|uniref:DNA endonuclease SmrA n=1 Tax=Neptuniibacter sp. CAU 1671 TaxID=3032593 RepID=UPI0023DC8DA0|nr:DNA endonuclease SmrA [Neptuniibacter sp. CAU 1671]MDF2181144.1 DNA endonuclease SmrA [Neptuniibacter sp. CAU 1671]